MGRQGTSTGRWKIIFSKSYQTKFVWKEGVLDLRIQSQSCCENIFKSPPFPPTAQVPSSWNIVLYFHIYHVPWTPTAFGRLKAGIIPFYRFKKLRLKDVCQTSQNYLNGHLIPELGGGRLSWRGRVIMPKEEGRPSPQAKTLRTAHSPTGATSKDRSLDLKSLIINCIWNCFKMPIRGVNAAHTYKRNIWNNTYLYPIFTDEVDVITELLEKVAFSYLGDNPQLLLYPLIKSFRLVALFQKMPNKCHIPHL